MTNSELRREIEDFVKMVRLRERQGVHPDAKVVKDNKTYSSIEAYLEAIIAAARLDELTNLPLAKELVDGESRIYMTKAFEDHYYKRLAALQTNQPGEGEV